MIYYHLWKEKGNKLPPDPLFLGAIEARETDSPLKQCCVKCLSVDHSVIDCSQPNYWEKSMDERQGHSAAGCLHETGRVGRKFSFGFWLSFLTAPDWPWSHQ
jgi:hypothetical protein